jgi:D-3-phosphoglycerate dehydrogenase
MRIILAGTYPYHTKAKFEALLPNAEIKAIESQTEYDAETEADLIIVRVLETSKKTIECKRQLKGIIRWGAGYDSVDIETAGRLGIFVAVTPGANAYAVSELTVGLMVAVGRRLMHQNLMTRSGVWDRNLFSEYVTTLNHKTVGIIGCGAIGRRVAKQVQCFGANVIYYDAHRLSAEDESREGMTYVSFDSLLRLSDVITIHIPLTDNTFHLIGDAEFAKMKTHVIVINSARGGIIDDAALLKALKSGKVLGAGLDCVENEKLEDNPLIQLDNVIVTPHIGGTSNDIANEMIPRIAKQVLAFAGGEAIGHVVNGQYLG